MSLPIGNDLVVSIRYKLSDDNGNVVDTTEGNEPLVYLHGAENIIPGLENALQGKMVGDSLKVTVTPDESYGEIIPELIQSVDRSAFPGIETIEVGMSFEAEDEDGSVERVVVKGVEGNEVTVDANHPLAGITLTFEVEVVDVREGTKEEIAHGHVH
jgi:FKBP-type peptidyl-prolyl cis-trans isomerase SlyD